MVLHGETTLYVGPSKEPEEDYLKKGRKETFCVGEGQELLGWEYFTDECENPYGVRFLTWKRPG